MAKAKKGARDYVAMECGTCGNRNYRTSKQLRGATTKLELTKYDPKVGNFYSMLVESIVF